VSGWPLVVAAVAVACLLAGWLAGRTEGDSVAWWEVSEAERLLAEEKDRADEMAGHLALYHRELCAEFGVRCPVPPVLDAHDAARAAEVER
jgi:hypothetical protein